METPVAEQHRRPLTRWEGINRSRWGQYLASEEERLVRRAIDRATGALPSPFGALDVGCEGGRWARIFTEAGWSVTATDVDPAVLAVCATRLPQVTCLLVNGAATSLPVPDSSVHVVTCMEVAPVVNSSWFLPEAARVLRAGGLLVMVAWNRRSIRGLAVAAAGRLRRRPDTFYLHSSREHHRRLTHAGFSVMEERGLCWCPFTRSSNSRLIPIATEVERRLGLRRLIRFSPWIVLIARLEPGQPGQPDQPSHGLRV